MWFSNQFIVTWRIMMGLVTPPPVSPLCRDTPITTREFFRESVMQHRGIFCILFRRLSIFAILASHHCSFDRINYPWHTDAASVFVVYPECCDVSPRPSCVVLTMSLISHESNQGLLRRRDAANQMHRKLLGTFHSVFAVILIQCQIWNKKDGAFTNNNGEIAFSASWWDSDKSSFRCKRD